MKPTYKQLNKMKNQTTASKIALIGSIVLTIAFAYACYNSMVKTRELCKLVNGTQTEITK